MVAIMLVLHVATLCKELLHQLASGQDTIDIMPIG